MNPSYRLVMQTGPTPGRDIPLQKNEIFIGRDLNNDIVINDAEVSRRHARLFLKGTTYMLEDLGSTNGSFINGQRLNNPLPVRPGEIITFGERINLIFEALSFSQPQVSAATSLPSEPPFLQTAEPISPEPAAAPAPPPAMETPSPSRKTDRLVPPSSPAFTGQLPQQSSAVTPVVKTRIPTWVWVVIVVQTILLIFLIIDDARLWCPLFGWLLNAIFPNSCPIQ